MTATPEPWNFTEAQRRQFREAHAEAKQRHARNRRETLSSDEDELRAEADEEMAYFDGPPPEAPATDVGFGAAWDLEQSPGWSGQSVTACCPRETIPDSCSCPDGCQCNCADCDCPPDACDKALDTAGEVCPACGRQHTEASR